MPKIKKNYTVTSLTPCRSCQGTGLYTRKPKNLAEKCTVCQGTGMLKVTKEVQMIIEPADALHND
ncbi:MAG: hypothetical protein PHQ65_11990 [Bacteroidales bacterium]|nr:hypothetical protein [Bacteroidales bacterium]MDD3665978.1 hypothetical protein [Bacteroidales bacterium]